jgi:hypothetical protein
VTFVRLRSSLATAPAWLRANRASLWLGAAFAAFYSLTAGWGLPAADHPDFTHGWATDSLLPLAPLAELNDLLFGRKYAWPLYPLFHHFVLAAFYAPYLGYEWLTGGLQAPAPVYPFGFADPVAGLQARERIGQAVAAVFGGVTVVATRHTARAFFGERAGWIAALAVGSALPVVYYARTGNVDGPMLTYVALGTWAFVRADRDARLHGAACRRARSVRRARRRDEGHGVGLLRAAAARDHRDGPRAARGAPRAARPAALCRRRGRGGARVHRRDGNRDQS